KLGGTQLLLRSQGSLGETLNQLPGVSSTYFGPNVSRPVIRGLDGDRIRILSNGGASLDASGLSYDHAVPLDPIAVDSIEVLRGPGALLYGGTAIGGVVNVLDNRIPREPLAGLTGRAEAGLASGNREKSGAAMLEGGNDRYALHVDAFARQSGEARVPQALACAQGGVTRVARRICNSDSDARGAGLGGTAFFDHGYLGASVSTFRNDYGSVAEDEVTIGMKSDRYALDGQWRPTVGPFASLRLQASRTDYKHTEFDAGQPGTVFTNRGNDLRLEARHRAFGPLTGVVGLQAEQARFSADGDEAFAPYSRTVSRALFIHEELATGFGKLSFGARRESARVESFGNPSVSRFVVGERRFEPTSYAVGALWALAPAWQATINLAHSERAPRDYELFANGPHLATGAWEVGDPTLAKERSANLDVGVQWKSGPYTAKLGAFVNRFSNYLSLQATGASVALAPGEFLPEYAYRQVRARLQGLEVSGVTRLVERPAKVDLEWRGDLVRADNLSAGEPLPRIAPVRIGATLAASQGAWGATLGFDASARQTRVPTGDRATAGYTLWNAALTRRTPVGSADLLWFARLENITDNRASSATSILTQTAPERVPLVGRTLKVGVRAEF
ncbi:MAG TPA: TonB-dependent receptor, partial [Ramlibacter sp.]|nr:TonB-dependent receptor [Ramlibacter sp.]